MEINKNKIYKSTSTAKSDNKKDKKEKSLNIDKADSFIPGNKIEKNKNDFELDLKKMKNIKENLNKASKSKAANPSSTGNETSDIKDIQLNKKGKKEKKETSVDLEDIKASVNKVTSKFKVSGKAGKSGQISSLEMKDYMIPANEGKVAHMCLTYGSYETVKDNYLEAMKTFFSKMPTAKFTVLTSNDIEKEELTNQVKEWTKDGTMEKPERINIIDSNANISIWAQDSTLVVGNKVAAQDRIGYPASGDEVTPKEISKNNPEIKFKKLDGIFVDGGNQLASIDKLFIGSDAIAFMVDNMKTYPSKYKKVVGDLKIKDADNISEEKLAKLMLDKTFPHQKVIIVGHKGQQPAFHIDMAMTPLGKPDPETGKPVMIVGDPSMALKILKDLKQNEPEKYAKYDEEVKRKVGTYSAEHPLDTLVDIMNNETNTQESFNAIAKGFEKSGYKVERVPYLGSKDTNATTPWITYNNSVIDGDNIFLPNFAMPELDNIANKIYKKYGYNPITIDMTSITSLQGAINCITKVVERTYSA